MLNIPQEDQAIFDEHIREASRILHKYTDPEKLKDFETIEVEARTLVMEEVAPKVGRRFFFRRRRKNIRKATKGKNMCREDSKHSKFS